MSADWNKIKTEYITTDISYRKLAQKYSVNYQTICARSKAEGWISLREQYRNKTLTKTVDAISEKQIDRAARLQTATDKLLGKVENLLDADEDLLGDTQSMRDISRILKDIKEIQMIRSDADMREQEARIRNLQKQAESDDSKKQISVVLEGELSKYAQ